MRITESCAKCLYDRQVNSTDNAEYLAEIKEILDNRSETATSPYMVYLFNKARKKHFGATKSFAALKRQYNDLVLEMEDALRSEIESADDPLAKALIMARIGNYIDFGAMNHVDQKVFMELFKDSDMRDDDKRTYDVFLKDCEKAKDFLLICDNCGEIVLDKLFIEQLKKRFPHLSVKAMVRGEEVLNDATMEDAEYVGLSEVAEVISNGKAIAGTIYDMCPDEAKNAINSADVILAKGQGNYESMSGDPRRLYFVFLCKCELFTGRFNVDRLTGMFVVEG